MVGITSTTSYLDERPVGLPGLQGSRIHWHKGTAFGHDFLGDRRAVLGISVVRHDLGAEFLDVNGDGAADLLTTGDAIYSMPPPSSGGVTMGEILNIMEGFGPLPPFGSTALMHREAEAMRRAFTDRNTYLGDPDFVGVPAAGAEPAANGGKNRSGICRRRPCHFRCLYRRF